MLLGRQLVRLGPILKPVDDIVTGRGDAVSSGDDPLQGDDGGATSGDLRNVAGCVDARVVAADDLPVVVVDRS